MKKLFCVFAALCVAAMASAELVYEPAPCDGWIDDDDGRSAALLYYQIKRDCDVPGSGSRTYYFFDSEVYYDGEREGLYRVILNWFISKSGLGWTSSYTDANAEAALLWEDLSESHAEIIEDDQTIPRSVRSALGETDSDVCCTVIVDGRANTAELRISDWNDNAREYNTIVYKGQR